MELKKIILKLHIRTLPKLIEKIRFYELPVFIVSRVNKFLIRPYPQLSTRERISLVWPLCDIVGQSLSE